jgi:hypothetical protein
MPVVVYVIAKFGKICSHQMWTGRCMLAFGDPNRRRTQFPSGSLNARYGFPLKVQNQRNP